MRKEWLANSDPSDILNHNETNISYQDFINKEMIHYAIDSNQRAIPNIMDGLKPG